MFMCDYLIVGRHSLFGFIHTIRVCGQILVFLFLIECYCLVVCVLSAYCVDCRLLGVFVILLGYYAYA